MALLTKRPILNEMAPLYDVGLNTTILIVGLGNPGKEYDGTRHNIGFAAIDTFAERHEFPGWQQKKDLHSWYASQTIGSTRVILCKPTTFMNDSGKAVQAVQHFYKVPNDKTLVVYDELDIDFGLIRTRVGGSSAGHNGIKSISQACGEEYGRVRIGIGPKKPKQIKSEDFVLAAFSKTQQKDLQALLTETNAILSEYAYGAGQLTAETRTFIV